MSGHIFIIGYMLAGKSTYGRRVAEREGLPFVDLDTEIEGRCGCTITEIFDREGELRFRQIEHETLESLCENSMPSVIACGGGTPCFHGNLGLMRENGHVVYLRTGIETIVRRAVKERKNRPLLAQIPDGQLAEEISKQYEKREETYLQADEIVILEEI